MNTLPILNVLKSDPFTKSLFTSVLPSDRLPDAVSERPKGFIVNTDNSERPGTHWIAIYLTRDGKGEFLDSYGQQPIVITVKTLKHSYKTIAILLFIMKESYIRHGLTCADSIANFMHYIDVEIYPYQLTIGNGTICF